MNTLIPVYNSDGSLYAWASEQRLARLQTGGLVARVVRNRKRQVQRAILFLRPDEPKPKSVRSVMGTRYSFKESLEHGPSWELKHLGGTHDRKTYAPRETRAAFLQVVADCTIPQESSEHRWGGASPPGTIESQSEHHAIRSSTGL